MATKPDSTTPDSSQSQNLPHAPNPILALKSIRLYLDQGRFSDALAALKEYGELYAAYALAKVEKERVNKVSDFGIVELKQMMEDSYVRFIDKLKEPLCLGWEHKVKTGTFGAAELEAHNAAYIQLGRHQALHDAVGVINAHTDSPDAKATGGAS
jgi:hypothetical protein